MGGRLAICAVLSALALLVAGCGGSNQTKAEAWADDVCSSVNTWADTVQQSKATLTDTGNLTVSSAKGALTDVEDATKTLADDLRNLGPPETDASNQAQQQITQRSSPRPTRSAHCSDRSRRSRPRSRRWARRHRRPTTTSAASTAAN